MATHPDSDHVQGIIELFKRFPPNVDATDRATFLFKGPLLLTKAFWKKKTDSYSFISHMLKESQFVGSVKDNGDRILGFENIFKFYYPDSNATGVVYNYVDPPPMPYPLPGKPPLSFAPNDTSILMLVKNPNDLSKPLISLNGDALGKSILQVVQDKPLKIFKVSHHGSKYNSLTLDTNIPDGQLDTQKLLATEALLEDVKLPLAYVLLGKNTKKFEEDYKSRFHKYIPIKDTLSLNDILCKVANVFQTQLKSMGYDTGQVLRNLEKRRKQIEANLKDSTVQPKDLYTTGTDIVPKFTVQSYTTAKRTVIAAQEKEDLDEEVAFKKLIPKNVRLPLSQLPYRKSQAFRTIFQYLETDHIFLDQVFVRFTTEFYSHINAETFFISSGSEHGHPHPSVTSGIIEAAKAKHTADSSYKCRLLLTSGNNINESQLPDYPVCSWKNFVSLQYFLGTTASVSIDPSVNPGLVLGGTTRWDGPGKISQSLLTEYNETKGARALKRKRATLDFKNYEITSSSGSWLYVTTNDDLKLSSAKTVSNVKAISCEPRHLEDVSKISLKSDTNHVAVLYGLVGYHVPDEPIGFTLFVYEQIDTKQTRKYLMDDNGTLKFCDKHSVTSFFFKKATAATAVLRMLSLRSIADSTVSTSGLSNYLRCIGSCDVATDLHSFLTSACGQPTPTETLEEAKHPLSHFLHELLSWKLDASSNFQLSGKSVQTASIVLHPSSSLSLWTNNVTSVTLEMDHQNVPVFEIKIEVVDENNMPSTLMYENVQWCKKIKDGQGTLVVSEPKSTLVSLTAIPLGTNSLSLKDYLNSIGYTGNPATLTCETLLGLLLSDQVVSQLTTTKKLSHNSSTYQFIQPMLKWVVLASSTVTISQNIRVMSSLLQLKLPLPLPTLNSNIIKAVSLEIQDPLTTNLKLGMKLEQTTTDGFPSTITYHLEWLIQCFPQQFDDFLQAIGITPPEDGFDIFDAVILLFQSETSGYFILNSFPKALISTVKGYKISKQYTTVAFSYSPTSVFLSGLGVELVADISDANNSLDIGLSHAVMLKKLTIYIPPYTKTSFATYITAEVKMGDQHLQMSANMMPNSLPSMEFKLINSLSLSDILSFLQLDSGIGALHVPILSGVLNDINITESGFTISQAVDESNTTTLSSVFFGVEFSNLGSYLPPVFSSLQQVNAQAVIYFPSIASASRIGFKVAFTCIIQENPAVTFSASLNAQPVLGTIGSNSGYNFDVSLSTSITEGISLLNILSTVGLGNALSSAMKIPILKSLLTNAYLKELSLALNTKSKAIETFSLHLLIPDWELISNKVSLTLFDLYMNYSHQSWEAAFEGTAVFGAKYPVSVQVKLPVSNEAAVLDFKNLDHDFSMAAFLSILGLGSIDKVPIIGKLLQISIVDVHLSINKPNDTSMISVEQGWVTLFIGSITINSIISLNQVSLQINFIKNTTTQSFNFGFHVTGFINEKVYLDVGYNPDKSILSGQALISSLKNADLAFIAKTFLSGNASSLELNDIYKLVSSDIVAGISLAFKFGDNVSLQHLVIEVKGKLPLVGTLYLASLRFEYLQYPETPTGTGATESDGLFPSGTSLSLIVTLFSDESKFHAQLQFDLNKDTTGLKTITASLKPIKEHSLKLSSFLSLLGLPTPEIPTVDGQTNPNFLDLELTSGSLTFSISPFSIKAFDVQIQTSAKIELMSSPRIQLESLSLRVNYDKTQSSTLKVFLLGKVSLANMKIWLEGSKNENGLVFKATTFFSSSSDHTETEDFQAIIKQLSPSSSTTPTLPTNVNLPIPIAVGVTQLIIRLLNDERSFAFCGASQNLNWHISLGFHDFTVNQLGGLINYTKMLTGKITTSFTCFVSCQFQFSSTITMDSELHFGSSIDTALVVLIRDVADIKIGPLVDDMLGFNHKKPSAPSNNESNTNSSADTLSFDSLLPKSVHSMNYSSAFLNLNLTKSQFLVAGELALLGTGFLFAGKLGNRQNYGYAFGITLPTGFKFSQLLQDLSIIDNILRIRKANVAILSLQDVKVSELVAAMKDAESSFIFQGTKPVELPFANLVLDAATNENIVSKGMSFYAEIDFNVDEDSVFNSIVQIGDPSLQLPDIVLSAQIASSPGMTRFEAHIERLILLGLLELQNISLEYEANDYNSLSLTGAITIHLGSTGYTYLGTLHSTNTEAVFSILNDPTKQPTITEPFCMFGISLEKTSLSLHYKFPKNKPHSSQYEISGTVDFFSSKSLSSTSSDSLPTPTISLTGWILFKNFKPTVISVMIEPTESLTVSDFVATVFKWHYGTKYLNIGFTEGNVYYASLPQDQLNVQIGDQTYSSGYHISADIEVFSHLFNITADIGDDKVSVTGSAYELIDLVFAKFTGVKKNDHSQPDEFRSPELSFTTSKSSTVISIKVGLVLFETPLATASIGYDVTKKVFLGQLTYSGDVGFIHNPSISFQWNADLGFQITDWPMSNPLPFDFFDKLKNYNDKCGALVDLVFDEASQTKFSINTEISKSEDSQFIAMIDITGTYDILLARKAKIAAIPLPKISVGIPKIKEFKLENLPEFILKLFTDNAESIIKQLVSDPKKLAKILGLVALKSITKEAVQTLVCRNVDDANIDPSDGNEDISDEDFEEAGKEKNVVDDLVDELGEALSEGSLGAAAGAATGAIGAAEGGISILAGIIGGLGSILSKFGISIYSKKQKEALRSKHELERKRQEAKKRVEDALDIGSAPSATFTPPDKLRVQWKAINYSGAHYHIKVTGSLVTTESGQSTRTVTIYNETKNTSSVEITNESLYHAAGLTVTIWGTITASKNGHTSTFNGKNYAADVPNVHPTLHSPSQVGASFDSHTWQTTTTASVVLFANAYYFQLGEGEKSFKKVAECTFTPHSDQTADIKCSFPHSSIPTESSGPFRVRCQAIADAGTGISSSEFTYSGNMLLAPPVSNLTVTLPHFGSEPSNVNLMWTLPKSTAEIVGLICQLLRMDTKAVILSQMLKEEQGQVLPTSYQFVLKDIVKQLKDNGQTALPAGQPETDTSVTLGFQVATDGKNNQVISSVFNEQTFRSLKSPSTVSFNFTAKTEKLRVSWEFTRETNNYGIVILDDKDSILWSKLVHIPSDDTEHEETAGYYIKKSELSAVANPKILYKVQVTSVTSGNEELDSLIPSEAQQKLHVCLSPIGKSLQFSSTDNAITAKFSPVPNATAFVIKIIGPQGHLAETNVKSPPGDIPKELLGSIDIETFIQTLAGGNTVKATLQSLGGSTFLSSEVSDIPDACLTVLHKPSNLTYSYLSDKEIITLKCNMVQGIQNYALGFHDPSGQVEDVKSSVQGTTAIATADISADLLRNSGVTLWKVFAHSVGDLTHLSSPLTFLSAINIQILQKPSILSFQYIKPGNLTVSWDTVLHSSGYKAQLQVLSTDSSILYETVKDVKLTAQTSVTTSFDTSTIPKWSSLLDKLYSVRVTATAIGSGCFITSFPGEPSSLLRNPAPEQLQYHYSPEENLITLKFNKVEEISKYVVGFNNPDAEVSSAVTGKIAVVSTTFPTDDLITKALWKVFAQSVGDTTHFSSTKTCLEKDVNVLTKPHIQCATYDVISKNFTTTWTCDSHCSHYDIKVSAAKNDGSVLKVLNKTVQLTSTSSLSLVVNMGTDIQGWDSLFPQVSVITVVVRAIGSGCFLSSPISEPQSLHRISSPTHAKVISDGSELEISWTAVSGATGYKTAIIINSKQVHSEVFSHSITVSKANESSLISQVPPAYVYNVKALITANSISNLLPSLQSKAQMNIFKQQLVKSQHYGGTGGMSFDDILCHSSPPIIGIKEIWIHHGDQVESLKAMYMLADGSTLVSNKHGGSGGRETYIEFEAREKIIEVKGMTDGEFVDQLTFITKTSSGAQKVYGPYGITGRTPFSVQGEIVAFYGRSEKLLISIGLYYIHNLNQSQCWGGSGGSAFDDNVPSPNSPIIGIKEIWIRHGDQVDSLKATYMLADGSTLVSSKHGGSGGHETYIEFEAREKIIEVKGMTDGELVDQLTFITKTSSGAQKVYGPYGITGRTPFSVQGEIVAFYGRSEKLLISIGLYYIRNLNQSQCWGGRGGSAFDDNVPSPNSPIIGIKEIWIRHGEKVDSLKATYMLADGSTLVSSKHGGSGGHETYIEFEAREKIIEVKGMTDGEFVDQLTFITKTSSGAQKVYGPYGITGHRPFSVQGEILAFYGRSEKLLISIGLYYIHNLNQSQCWGGSGGSAFDDNVPSPNSPIIGIKEIWIRHGDQVDSLKATYMLADGSTLVSNKHGGSGGHETYIEFEAREKIIEVKGMTDGEHVDQLTFITKTSSGVQKVYGPYGITGRTPFSVQGEIVAFYGRSEKLLISIGLYYIHNLNQSQCWGGSGGSAFDDNVPSPNSPIIGIKEIWIRHGDQVDSLKATYMLADGSTLVSSKHGGSGGHETYIEFEAREKITEVKGMTDGEFVDQLTFITKTSSGAQKVYGPYGITGRTPFSVQGEIVAFYGRSEKLLISIGLYYIHNLNQSQCWGGSGGSAFDDNVPSPNSPIIGIKEIWIRHGDQVDSLKATYMLADGSTLVSSKHGGSGGHETYIEFEAREKIIEVKGMTDGELVDQLTFITKTSSGVQKVYGPYGITGRTPFSVQGEIVAFYGRSEKLLISIGLYYIHNLNQSQCWGGSGGSAFDDNVPSPNSPIIGIKEIWIRHGDQVDSLKATYMLADGSTLVSSKHGGSGGHETYIEFEAREEIIEVKGMTDGELVDQLTFITKTSSGVQKVYGPYGITGHRPFSVQGEIVAFYGRSGIFLDSIGFYQ